VPRRLSAAASATNIPDGNSGRSYGRPDRLGKTPVRVLVIYCHRDDTSFASALHKSVLESLARSGHSVTDLDLYDEGFRPVMTREERAEYDDSPLYIKSVAKYAGQLASAEAVVAVYPTWWYGLPAMLKGYGQSDEGPERTFRQPRETPICAMATGANQRGFTGTAHGDPSPTPN